LRDRQGERDVQRYDQRQGSAAARRHPRPDGRYNWDRYRPGPEGRHMWNDHYRGFNWRPEHRHHHPRPTHWGHSYLDHYYRSHFFSWSIRTPLFWSFRAYEPIPVIWNDPSHPLPDWWYDRDVWNTPGEVTQLMRENGCTNCHSLRVQRYDSGRVRSELGFKYEFAE
jgi:hypothetical protein